MPMRAGEARLAIDCGTTSTVAVLAWPDGSWSPLSFDGAPHLSSAVYLSPDDDVWTGQRAWQAAADQPNRFIPAPRRPTDDQLTIDGTVVDALDLAAATLRRVAAEAERVAGGPVQDVRVVVPAGWGPRRRTWMRQAAHRAGLPQPRLVEAPVAVAEHLVATGLQCRVGSFIAVCDLGAGAEATVLRRGPAGFEVLATLADPAAGGTAIDQALAASLTGDPMPEDAGDGALRWTVAASVQAAKEALAHHPAVTVPLPNRPPIIVNNTMLEQAAHPVLQRAAQLTSEAVTAAEIRSDELAGVYCVGGGAHLPQLEKLIADQTGVAPTVVTQPALVAARGAADAGAANPSTASAVEVPVPPVRRAVAIAVPGFASLALIWQCLMTAEQHSTLNVHYWVTLNWGELTMAAVFALLACLGAGTILGSLAAAHSPTPTPGPKAERSASASSPPSPSASRSRASTR